jgi:hypothetical protein
MRIDYHSMAEDQGQIRKTLDRGGIKRLLARYQEPKQGII